MSKEKDGPARAGSFRRSILPLFRIRTSRARTPSTSSVDSRACQESPGVSMNRICLPAVSIVTSCGSVVVVGPRDEEDSV